jgi:hypothetical protein
MKEVEKKLLHLQQQLERWILRSAYFLPDGDVLDLYQSIQALEGIRKDLDTLKGSTMSARDEAGSEFLPITE